MKAILTTLTLLALAGCSTLGQWRREPASPQLVAKMAGAHSATFVMDDGRIERMTTIRDFGDALCGINACVRKADIAEIGYAPRQGDTVGSLLAVPLVPAVATVKALGCYPSCGYPDRPPEGPKATPDQVSRAWLQSLVIREGLIVHVGAPNPCIAPSPAAPGRAFATDDEAIAWIVDNRTQVRTTCLAALNDELGERDRQTGVKHNHAARMRLDTLLSVRERWNHAHCQLGANDAPRFSGEWVRVAPPQEFDLASGRGDPALLAIIDQTLADPATYANDADFAVTCTIVLPASQWPDRETWARKASPFAPVMENEQADADAG